MSNRIHDLLAAIEENCNVSEKADAALQVGIEAVGLVEDQLPPSGVRMIEQARRSTSGKFTAEEIEPILVDCWRDIDNFERERGGYSGSHFGLRAAVGLLHIRNEVVRGEFFESLCSTFDFVNRIRDHSIEQERLLFKYFGECLDRQNE